MREDTHGECVIRESDPQPSGTKTTSHLPVTEALGIAVDAYIYGLPLVTMT